MWQASLLCTCASNSCQNPGLTLVHGPPMTSDPLSQDGRTAPALVQQGPFLRSLDLRSGQDKLLLKNVQLFGETCGCLWGWVGRAWVSQVALVVKIPPANAGDERDMCSIPGWGRSPGGRRGNPLQYSCLENPTDRGAWWATVHRVTKSRTQVN